jgi:hypothetical protein
MPLKVLTRHGVVSANGQLVSLNTEGMTLEQRAHVRMLCEQRLQSFVQKRGIGIWDYRLLDEEPIPDSLRFQVLKAAGGRCQSCGITSKEPRWMLIISSLDLVEAGQNLRTYKPYAASATAPNEIRTKRISAEYRPQLSILSARADFASCREEWVGAGNQ